MVEKIGVLNQGTVEHQTNIITIHEAEKARLIYSDPLPELRYFQGRQEQLGQLNTWLQEGTTAIIGVRGEGGIGKSTLVGKAFADCPGFASKFWADVRTGTNLSALARRALLELDVPIDQVQAIEDKDLPQRLLRHLQMGRYLLAIDNMESLLTPEGEWQGGYADFLRDFQQLGSQSVLLLASREYPAKYFGWRQSEWLLLDEGLSPEEGAALLGALGVENDPAALVPLAQRLQGNPLALTLVAGWLCNEYRPGNRWVSHLEQFDNLFQLRGDRPYETDISAEDVLVWSLERLPEPLRHLLNQASVFQNEFTAEMAAALVLEQPVTDADLRDLDRRSLLQELSQPSAAGHLQFRLQPRIREFVQRQAGDLTTAHERAIAYFWSHRRQEFGPNDTQDAAKEYLETFYHQVQLGRFNDAAIVVGKCDIFFSLRGYYATLADLYGQLYRQWRPTQAENLTFAAVCGNLGIVYNSRGQYQQAIECHQRSLAIKREMSVQEAFLLESRHGEANSLSNLGNVYHSLGEYHQAIKYHQQSLAIMREIGVRKAFPQESRRGEASSLGNLGNVYQSLGQYQQALEYQQQSLTIAREIGDRQGEADSLGSLGNVYDSLGQDQQTIKYHQQWLAIAREIGDRKGEANSLGSLGNVYRSLGQSQQAIQYLQQALAIAQEIGDRQGEATSLFNLGGALASVDQKWEARQAYESARTLYQVPRYGTF
ncbi:tetratricopeptide repeat protein [Leptolyngbya sp. KIOST-1]|uniref:tetratricopeptide repeat protein n=1 Tax=Leptolyngbya sp. KIOST-1 TaxID=1229172 RepID=UPI00068E2FC6|nr:tetratricopeptide repeat protein [Leptolyngbya sp. KIOST-1]